MREREQTDHGPCGVARGTSRDKRLPRAPVGGAWPESIAISQIGQCAGFGAQSGDDVVVIDDMNRAGTFAPAAVDGGQNPRINGDERKAGTVLAVTPSEPKDWTTGPLSTPSAAEGGGRRPAFTGGLPSRHTGRPGDGACLPDSSTAQHRGDPVTKTRRLDADLRRR